MSLILHFPKAYLLLQITLKLISIDFLLISRALNLYLSLAAQSLLTIFVDLSYFLNVLIIVDPIGFLMLNLTFHQNQCLFIALCFALKDHRFSFIIPQFMFLNLKFMIENQHFFSIPIPKFFIIHHFYLSLKGIPTIYFSNHLILKLATNFLKKVLSFIFPSINIESTQSYFFLLTHLIFFIVPFLYFDFKLQVF